MNGFKQIGLLALSVLCVTASAGVGSASAASFTAAEAGKSLSGFNPFPETFEITGQAVECASSSVSGVTEGSVSGGKVHSESLKYHPMYAACDAFGFTEGVTVSTGGCQYRLTAGTSVGMGELRVEGCISGVLIKVENLFVKCEVSIENQAALAAASYTNVGSPNRLAVGYTANLTANVTVSTGLCPLIKGVHLAAVSYRGEMRLAGSNLEYTP